MAGAAVAGPVRRQGRRGVGVIAKGQGRKPALPEGTVAEIVRVTCHEAPDDTSTHWTTRSLAKRFGIGKDAIARVWADHNLKPWRVNNFKLSSDPRFEEKLVDVVGFYMNPPARAAVFSFDEKTQCQADGPYPAESADGSWPRGHDDQRLQAATAPQICSPR